MQCVFGSVATAPTERGHGGVLTQQVYRSDMWLLVVHEFMCCSDVSDVDALAQVKYMSRALPY